MGAKQLLSTALLAAAMFAGCASNTTSSVQPPDPVSADPVAFDKEFPAAFQPFTVTSGGAVLNGRGLLAQGRGPHHTVLLLHGLPGNELNLDLAQAMRRAGWNVFTFHYRGNWGSGGDYSFSHDLEDTRAVLAFLRSKGSDPKWRLDSARIVLVGHSLGGFVALQVGAADSQVKSIASISGFDFGAASEVAAAQPEARQGWIGFFKSATSLKVPDVDAMVNDWLAHGSAWKLTALSDSLSKKNVLLVAGSRDTLAEPPRHHAPLVLALKSANSTGLTEVILDSDHNYSDRRIALTKAVLSWLARQE